MPSLVTSQRRVMIGSFLIGVLIASLMPQQADAMGYYNRCTKDDDRFVHFKVDYEQYLTVRGHDLSVSKSANFTSAFKRIHEKCGPMGYVQLQHIATGRYISYDSKARTFKLTKTKPAKGINQVSLGGGRYVIKAQHKYVAVDHSNRIIGANGTATATEVYEEPASELYIGANTAPTSVMESALDCNAKVSFLVDESTSMSENDRLEDLKVAIGNLIRDVPDDKWQASLVGFAGIGTSHFNPQVISGSPDLVVVETETTNTPVDTPTSTPIPTSNGTITSLAVSQHQPLIALGLEDGSIQVFGIDVDGFTLLHVSVGHLGPVHGLAFTHQSGQLLSVGPDGFAQWDLEVGGISQIESHPGASVTQSTDMQIDFNDEYVYIRPEGTAQFHIGNLAQADWTHLDLGVASNETSEAYNGSNGMISSITSMDIHPTTQQVVLGTKGSSLFGSRTSALLLTVDASGARNWDSVNGSWNVLNGVLATFLGDKIVVFASNSVNGGPGSTLLAPNMSSISFFRIDALWERSNTPGMPYTPGVNYTFMKAGPSDNSLYLGTGSHVDVVTLPSSYLAEYDSADPMGPFDQDGDGQADELAWITTTLLNSFGSNNNMFAFAHDVTDLQIGVSATPSGDLGLYVTLIPGISPPVAIGTIYQSVTSAPENFDNSELPEFSGEPVASANNLSTRAQFLQALNALTIQGSTYLSPGMTIAQTHLTDPLYFSESSPVDARPKVLIIVSDGAFFDLEETLALAEDLKNQNIKILTVGIGLDQAAASIMRNLASGLLDGTQAYFDVTPDPETGSIANGLMESINELSNSICSINLDLEVSVDDTVIAPGGSVSGTIAFEPGEAWTADGAYISFEANPIVSNGNPEWATISSPIFGDTLMVHTSSARKTYKFIVDVDPNHAVSSSGDSMIEIQALHWRNPWADHAEVIDVIVVPLELYGVTLESTWENGLQGYDPEHNTAALEVRVESFNNVTNDQNEGQDIPLSITTEVRRIDYSLGSWVVDNDWAQVNVSPYPVLSPQDQLQDYTLTLQYVGENDLDPGQDYRVHVRVTAAGKSVDMVKSCRVFGEAMDQLSCLSALGE